MAVPAQNLTSHVRPGGSVLTMAALSPAALWGPTSTSITGYQEPTQAHPVRLCLPCHMLYPANGSKG